MKLKRLTSQDGGYEGRAWRCPGCRMMLHQVSIRRSDGHSGPVWTFDGNEDAPTFAPSILIRYPWGDPPRDYVCHCFVRAGMIEFLGDCTHALAGQTVPLPDLPTGYA